MKGNFSDKLLIKILLIILVCCNIYFGIKINNNNNLIETNHSEQIYLFGYHIAKSCEHVRVAKNSDSIKRKMLFLNSADVELDAALHVITLCTPYYNTKTKFNRFYLGNDCASTFFMAYQTIIKDWIDAYGSNDVDKIPHVKDLKKLYNDLKNISNEFQVYANNDYSDKKPITKLNMVELEKLFIELAKNTELDKIYNFLSLRHPFKDNLNK